MFRNRRVTLSRASLILMVSFNFLMTKIYLSVQTLTLVRHWWEPEINVVRITSLLFNKDTENPQEKNKIQSTPTFGHFARIEAVQVEVERSHEKTKNRKIIVSSKKKEAAIVISKIIATGCHVAKLKDRIGRPRKSSN
nr:unnamed protein product [Callosobruchus analis]